MKMRSRWIIVIVLLMTVVLSTGTVSAHANLRQSDPPANSVLDTAPAEIRLWFTEPLEHDYSSIFLRNQNGDIVVTPPSQLDASDRFQMFVVPGDLPDGLYTVVWRVISAADGHPTYGSYPFIIGAAAGGFGDTVQQTESIPVDNSLIRWANLFSLSLAVGGIAFLMFVWNPAVPEDYPLIRRRLWWGIWIGWMVVGMTGILLLLMQYSIVIGSPLLSNIKGAQLEQLIGDTRFGQLWLTRMALWVGMGLALVFARTDRWFFPVALALGFFILLTNSLFSHANAAQDVLISVGADWLHLVAATLWLGGLIQFVNVIGPVRTAFDPSTPVLSRLVGYFTNFARVSVAALVVTGLYAAWLQVGTVDALLTTPYGQVLFIKLVLFLPVFGIATINMLVTHRALEAGQNVWGKRLRGLVGMEIALLIGILGAVGVMTSIAPARTILDQRAAVPKPPEPQPIVEALTAESLNVQLDISPGWVGENTFTLTLTDENGAPVTDPTLIRMRFESQEQNLGESELRPEAQGEGVYIIVGANLSVPGAWRIRTTVQRPNRFDALVDFKPTMDFAPPQVVPEPIDTTAPMPSRTLILLLVGVVSLAIGGFFLGENRLRPPRASGLLGIGLLAVGLSFLFAGVIATPETTSASDFVPPPDAPINMAVTSNTQIPYPFLITSEGDLLQPDESGVWTKMALDAHVRDAYIDVKNVIWASSDKGLYAYIDDVWQKLDEQAGGRIQLMHGYVFSLESRGITRLPAGGSELEKARQLPIPLIDEPVEDMVMLGNHTHVLQNGGQVFLTNDLGLSWDTLNAPEAVDAIGVDADGNLLAVTGDNIQRWNYVEHTWKPILALPGDDANATLRVYIGQLYALGNGQLYRQQGNTWESVDLGVSDDIYLTGLEFQYPRTLWVLDARGRRLWSTIDGRSWNMTDIEVE